MASSSWCRCGSSEAVDAAMAVMCGVAATLALIGVGGGRFWSDVGHSDGIWAHSDEDYNNHEYQTTRTFSILGTLTAMLSFILTLFRLRVDRTMQSKTFRVLFVSCISSSFLCLLVSVAVWGDFVSHRIREMGRDHDNKFLQQLLRQTASNEVNSLATGSMATTTGNGDSGLLGNLHLGWACWVTITADIVLFCANLLHLMGRDCRQAQSWHDNQPYSEDRHVSSSQNQTALSGSVCDRLSISE